MTRLDDARVNGTDCDFMDLLAKNTEKFCLPGRRTGSIVDRLAVTVPA